MKDKIKNKATEAKEQAQTLFDNLWTLLIKAGQVIAAVNLYQQNQVETAFGTFPVMQVLAAVITADALLFFYRLLTAQKSTK